MLSWACRRFRARFTAGDASAHRRACQDCNAYAAAVERAAGTRLPLPASLQRNLRKIAGTAASEPAAALPFPVPRLPVPDALATRLRSLARPARSTPPEWVRSPRFALAASVILALLVGPVLAGAADRGQQALRLADQEVTPLLADAGAVGRKELMRLRLAAIATCDAISESAADSVRHFHAGLSDISAWMSNVLPENFMNPDPRHEAGGFSRRSQ